MPAVFHVACAAVFDNNPPVPLTAPPVVTARNAVAQQDIQVLYSDPDGDGLGGAGLDSAVGPSGLRSFPNTSELSNFRIDLGNGDGVVELVSNAAAFIVTWTPSAGSNLLAVSGSIVVTYYLIDDRGVQATGTVTFICEHCCSQDVCAVHCKQAAGELGMFRAG